MNRNFYIILFLLFAALLETQKLYPAEIAVDSILAKVNDKVISSKEFKVYYKNLIKKLGLNDNLSNRKKILEQQINDYVFLTYAISNGYDKRDESKNEMLRIKNKVLLDLYIQHTILPKIKTTEDELIETFRRMNTKVKISHIFSPSKNEIEKIYLAILKSASFDSIAFNVFTDPELKRNYGSLGYISYDEMDPNIEDAAYSMFIGEISKPIKTAYGYSIVRVDDKIILPVITENDFMNKKDQIYQLTAKKKINRYKKNLVDSLSKILNPRFDEIVVDEFYNEIQKLNGFYKPVESDKTFDRLKKKIIVNTSKTVWKVEKVLSMMSPIIKSKIEYIKSSDNLKEFIIGLLVQDYFLMEARNIGLDKLDKYYSIVQEEYDKYLINEVSEKIKSDIQVSDKEIFDYYHTHLNKFQEPEQFRLSAILLDDKSKAIELEALLDSNKDFTSLVKLYSIQKISADKNGDIGFFTRSELSQIDSSLSTINAGDIQGPINNGDKYLFVKCTDKISAVTIPLEKVRNKIIDDLKGVKYSSNEKAFITKQKNLLSIKVDNQLLKRLNLND